MLERERKLTQNIISPQGTNHPVFALRPLFALSSFMNRGFLFATTEYLHDIFRKTLVFLIKLKIE